LRRFEAQSRGSGVRDLGFGVWGLDFGVGVPGQGFVGVSFGGWGRVGRFGVVVRVSG
jgi:hypothetical protein